jgi:hypothetical protein
MFQQDITNLPIDANYMYFALQFDLILPNTLHEDDVRFVLDQHAELDFFL